MADYYKVNVINNATGEIVKSLHAETEREAFRLERGVNINLNLDAYYTVIERHCDVKNKEGGA